LEADLAADAALLAEAERAAAAAFDAALEADLEAEAALLAAAEADLAAVLRIDIERALEADRDREALRRDLAILYIIHIKKSFINGN